MKQGQMHQRLSAEKNPDQERANWECWPWPSAFYWIIFYFVHTRQPLRDQDPCKGLNRPFQRRSCRQRAQLDAFGMSPALCAECFVESRHSSSFLISCDVYCGLQDFGMSAPAFSNVMAHG